MVDDVNAVIQVSFDNTVSSYESKSRSILICKDRVTNLNSSCANELSDDAKTKYGNDFTDIYLTIENSVECNDSSPRKDTENRIDVGHDTRTRNTGIDDRYALRLLANEQFRHSGHLGSYDVLRRVKRRCVRLTKS